MTEKPILFNGEMVRAILAGRKTQTRRPIKRPEQWMIEFDGENHTAEDKYGESYDIMEHHPFAADRLWVRETWQPYSWDWREGWMDVRYRAGGQYSNPIPVPDNEWLRQFDVCHQTISEDTWHPSIHMPRWASRIDLTVKRVWVERVQDISPDDCLAEGLIPECTDYSGEDSLRWDYRDLWDSIYAEQWLGWDKNPWVWCCEFEMLQPNGD